MSFFRKYTILISWQCFIVFEDYLKNSKIYTCFNVMKTVFQKLSFGVPQGSVLRPILFNLTNVNNLTNVSKFKTTLFANDANFHINHQKFTRFTC